MDELHRNQTLKRVTKIWFMHVNKQVYLQKYGTYKTSQGLIWGKQDKEVLEK